MEREASWVGEATRPQRRATYPRHSGPAERAKPGIHFTAVHEADLVKEMKSRGQ